ncbi:glutamine synthetase [Rhodococcus kronopolitis]|uniref:Glutamine synthetase n=1 Tax=Rhodococcus kronopolitis TaxID=1460226 RepID=A0ABV9FWI2_9NOCA
MSTVHRSSGAPLGRVIGSVVDMSGISRAKVMPAARLPTFASAGAGASPSWCVFCVDDHIAFTPTFSAVGDLRLRIQADQLRDLGQDARWAPADLVDQDARPHGACPRGALRRAVDRLADADLEARIGHEIEFCLFDALPADEWSAYGLTAVLSQEPFVRDLVEAADRAGLAIEQVHAEYGPNQFEISLAPTDPVAAADDSVLARILVSRAARAHGMRASFSPLPTLDGAGNGAHQHLSLSRRGRPVLSGGDGPHGLTATGRGAVAGLVRALPELMLVLAGSALSHRRLRPNTWAGAYACWGLENREAAVRLCADTPGNPHGAHLEVKPIDPSANPYLASAAVLGAALDGIEADLPLPGEVTVNPDQLGEERRRALGVEALPTEPEELLGRFRASRLTRELFDPLALEALYAVRNYEITEYRDAPAAEVVDRFRFAWTM